MASSSLSTELKHFFDNLSNLPEMHVDGFKTKFSKFRRLSATLTSLLNTVSTKLNESSNINAPSCSTDDRFPANRNCLEKLKATEAIVLDYVKLNEKTFELWSDCLNGRENTSVPEPTRKKLYEEFDKQTKVLCAQYEKLKENNGSLLFSLTRLCGNVNSHVKPDLEDSIEYADDHFMHESTKDPIEQLMDILRYSRSYSEPFFVWHRIIPLLCSKPKQKHTIFIEGLSTAKITRYESNISRLREIFIFEVKYVDILLKRIDDSCDATILSCRSNNRVRRNLNENFSELRDTLNATKQKILDYVEMNDKTHEQLSDFLEMWKFSLALPDDLLKHYYKKFKDQVKDLCAKHDEFSETYKNLRSSLKNADVDTKAVDSSTVFHLLFDSSLDRIYEELLCRPTDSFERLMSVVAETFGFLETLNAWWSIYSLLHVAESEQFKTQKKRPCRPYFIPRNSTKKIPLSMHHIIPSSLLKRFVDRIIKIKEPNTLNLLTTLCDNLIIKFKNAGFDVVDLNSMSETELKQYRTNRNMLIPPDGTPKSILIQRGDGRYYSIFNWLPGNIIEGPRDRSDDPKDQFEINSIFIVGERKYRILKELYEILVCIDQAEVYLEGKKRAWFLILCALEEIDPELLSCSYVLILGIMQIMCDLSLDKSSIFYGFKESEWEMNEDNQKWNIIKKNQELLQINEISFSDVLDKILELHTKIVSEFTGINFAPNLQ